MVRAQERFSVAAQGGAPMTTKLQSAIASAKDRRTPKLASAKRVMSLEHIKDRPHGDTRALNNEHVGELVESIAAVGLIQPIAVDKAGHLLAGGHRRAALEILSEINPQRYLELFPSGIPVRAFDFDAAKEQERSLAIEAAENEKRRDYTPAEVRELADRLIEAGYRATGGKPKKGQKALTPALVTIVGKSRRTIQRYLESQKDTASYGAVSTTQRDKLLQRTLNNLEAMRRSAEFDDSEQKDIARALKLLHKLHS